MKQSIEQSIEQSLDMLRNTNKRLSESVSAVQNAIRENHMVIMPSKLPQREEYYHMLEGVEHDGSYYLILYYGIVRNLHDYDIIIDQISSAPVIETKKGDDTYKIMRKVPKPVHDFLLDYVDKYFFENDIEEEIRDSEIHISVDDF